MSFIFLNNNYVRYYLSFIINDIKCFTVENLTKIDYM